ncbi:MAG: GNAT family N-acetyltransferase [Rhodospirillales bacterium]|mgnify:CR=1 FL=1|jgi:RimJ/RimL family protein N-acetyltransferase|nr:GNAT family N-acetyltransferase [Rhodospirillales bacterium]
MTPIPTLQTERLNLRPIRPEDFEAYAAFYQTERSHLRGGPLSRDNAWRQFASEIGHWSLRGYGPWAIEEKETDAYCGLVSLWYPEGWPAPEVGWVVWEQHEGRGIAFEASIRARAYAFESLGWPEVASCINAANTRSIRLAERLGARLDRRIKREDRPDFLIYLHPSP